jgi:UDP-N-acetyl-D-mannosaminuronic acid dehydrogenase
LQFAKHVVVVGGCGHVGLPLSVAFADRGLDVGIYDISPDAVARVNRGELPADEPGLADALGRVVGRRLTATTDPAIISDAENVVVVIGTPVNSHLSPNAQAVPRAIESLVPYLRPGQLLILRSTVYPGVTAQVERLILRLGLDVDVAFCPERIAEGKAMVELFSLPQIVSARNPAAAERASRLFHRLTEKVIELAPEEAELAKLFTNTWRYIKFAAANQLFMIANDQGLDFERIRHAIADDYPRAADIAQAGFAAGPCLLKDTMQLAEFFENQFSLGHASLVINEGLPLYVVSRIERRYDLSNLTVGILGMAFKGESDDTRSSLSYKLKRVLEFKALKVLTTDEFVVDDPALSTLADVVAQSDLLVIGAPHKAYRDLKTDKPVIDIWNLFGQGVKI